MPKTVIMTSVHLRIVKRVKRKALLAHLCGILLMIGICFSGWIYDLDRRIIVASYQTLKYERNSILLKYDLLQILRKRPLTIGAAIDIMEAVTNQKSVPIPIILAILDQESQFDPRAISLKGAKGSGQLMPIVWKQYGNGTNIHDSLSNISASIAYLTDLYKTFGTWDKTLRSYAAGPTHATDKNIEWYSRAVLGKATGYQAKIER